MSIDTGFVEDIPQYLYKYRGGNEEIFKRDLVSLLENYYWAASIPTLNDPCEALINTDTYFSELSGMEGLIKRFLGKEESLAQIRTATQELLDKVLTTGIFSLSKAYDDELMWSHYAAAHHGFCIGYNMHYLKRSLKPYFFDVMELRYEDSPPEMNFMQQMLSAKKEHTLLQLIGTKSTKWANEKEVRIVCDKPGRKQHDFRSVDSIYFGLRMKEEHKDRLMSALSGRNVKYFQMELMKGTYKFEARPVADKYIDVPKYLYAIHPVMEGAVDEASVQSRFKHLKSYLHKAVEIARREPYCLEVITADFSYTCPDDAPYIFVNCKRSDGDHSNFEYTLAEIDLLYEKLTDLDN